MVCGPRGRGSEHPMTQTTTLERLLLDDLDTAGERAADETFCADLYRALTNNVWRVDRDPEGRLSPSWRRAEELVGEWRVRHGHEPLTLAQTGGEGEISDDVGRELGRLGWSARPLDTSTDHPAHLGADPSPPPSPPTGTDEERAAHEAAEAERRRTAR